MNRVIQFDSVEQSIISLRNMNVILDADVASLYGVETRDVNKAIRNNPDKFPPGYIFNLQTSEKQYLVENFHRFERLKFSTVTPRAFTEKGLYMLATILKSKQATETTIAIVEAYAKLRDLSRTLAQMVDADENRQKSLLQKSGELLDDILDSGMHTTDSETTIELNLAVLKVKHTVKRKEK